MIPPFVVEAAMNAYRDSGGSPEYEKMSGAINAALDAWTARQHGFACMTEVGKPKGKQWWEKVLILSLSQP
jgi:hypothetical protein